MPPSPEGQGIVAAAAKPFLVMSKLPTGTVTFLFTDIEGSTRL
jgi:class 3 adenylate cyclase